MTTPPSPGSIDRHKTTTTESKPAQLAEQFNMQCQRSIVDRGLLNTALSQQADLYQMVIEQRPYLFSEAAVFVSEAEICRQQELIAAITKVIAMPLYQRRVLAYAPACAHYVPKAQGVFFGYDFHISSAGSKLIEINTNAGGALFNAMLIGASLTFDDEKSNKPAEQHDSPVTGQNLEHMFFDMFIQEWQLERGKQVLRTIAIVDEQPQQQYMLPEFILFKYLFEQQGIKAVICDPFELEFKENALWHDRTHIDLVYNRLTDFGFESASVQQLSQAYQAGAVVVTPHPRAHALYADKRNLVLLSDPIALSELGVDKATCAILQSGIARTHQVNASDAGALWSGRKHLFFKPAKGYGSKAAYRGDKLTQRVFTEILNGNYVAQLLVPPGVRQLNIKGQLEQLKWDLRHYVYQNDSQLVVARLYQGQTTNFRTPGGGFARVIGLV